MGVQVQSATKNGQGESLSILNRQFISFSYGGKNIEDFDLLAVFSNDRLEKEIYAPFNDTTTEQAELDGQMFWRSNFKAGQLSFTLATDGMTAAQLEDFKEWFQPGKEKELILSEYHNRGILARVASVPQISLLPFEKEVEVQIGDNFFSTKTSLYKGDIKLEFIMDDPYWYSINTCIDSMDEESLKLIYEDGIPHIQMFQTECFLANNQRIKETLVEIGKDEENNSIFEKRFTSMINQGIDLLKEEQNSIYLYYCGTAPERPLFTFNISPEVSLNEEDEYRFYYHYKYLSPSDLGFITFQKDGEESKFLNFSLPSLLTSYNRAIDIVQKYPAGKSSILDLRKDLRDNLYNYHTRSFAIGLVDAARQSSKYTNEGLILTGFHDFFYQEMTKLLNSSTMKYSINCKTGQVQVTAKINKIKTVTIDKENQTISFAYSSSDITENAGNMIKSNYLTIETRTLPIQGKIASNQCLYVAANTDITSLQIDYRYKYL